MTTSRRNMLKSTLASIGLFGAASAFARVEDLCLTTPAQPEGPFYPVQNQSDTNTDLTYVDGRRGSALGDVIYVEGIVADSNCRPVERATVEIWQACATGRYNHPEDRDNPGALDPNFQYWGVATTNTRGEYRFKTIIPGHYSAGPGWIRPPHIHFKVHRRGYHELITQMYFEGNRYNDGDLILRQILEAERKSVVVPLIDQRCHFNITLNPVT